ncbi:glycosyltransferase family 4 protein [Candidatus Saccharibacteria bacterium]|nr:glycosyltransferase family 4 protein [Candidatus Saccharibacteria bacterium]
MKIGLFCPYSMAHRGGVQEFVRDMYQELKRRGHEVKIITPQPKDIVSIDTTDIIFVGSASDFRSPLGTTSAVSASIDNEAIEQLLESEKFDVLHFHEPWVPFLSRQVLSRSSTVNIGTFHAKVPENIVSRSVVKVVTPYTKSVLKYLDELTATGPPALEYISSLTDRPVSVIPLLVDLDRFKRPAKRSSAAGNTILYVGRLERRKGVRYLLRAYQLLQQEVDDLSLLIAGDGPEREMLEEMVVDLGLHNVSFLGYISDEEKVKLLRTSDLFCAPSIYGEGFGIVLLEAMAMGIVAVAGDNSGYAAALQEMGAISLVNSRDSKDFARRLKLLLTEPALRNVWQDWAAEYVQQFGRDQVMDQFEELYEQALENHRSKQ